MEIVAKHLQSEAGKRSDLEGRDFFGRTAFNRYYYATFLDVKNVLGALNPDWGTMAHAAVPEVLRGTVKRELQKGLKKAHSTSDPQTATLCNQAIAATTALAKLMEEGKITRVTADYHPEIKIQFVGVSNFNLNQVAIKDASNWPNKARALARTIEFAWKQIHV